MAKTFELHAKSRAEAGKGAARAIRREGRIPAVIYGGNEAPVTITLLEKDLVKVYHGGSFFTQICEMDVDGKSHKLLGRDIQLHPVSDRPLHVDFLRVTDKTRLTVSVPMTFINEDKSPGLSAGGILSIARREVDVVARAIAIPDELVIDLTGAETGDTLTSALITLPEGSEFAISDRDFAVANIAAPRVAAAEEETTDAEGEAGEDAAAEATADAGDA